MTAYDGNTGVPLEPIPYHWQTNPPAWRQVLLLLLAHFWWRGLRCRRHFCTWNATEQGWFCDRHDPHRESYGIPPEQLPADPFEAQVKP